MKKLFYSLSLIAVLSACGENAEEKAFLDRNVNNFLEYERIASITPRISLSHLLTRMTEIKLKIQDYKYSKNCQKTMKYLVKNMDLVQDRYKDFMLEKSNFLNLLDQEDALDQLKEFPSAKSCKEVANILDKIEYVKEQNKLLEEELRKENPDNSKVIQYLKKGAIASNTDIIKAIEHKNKDIVSSLIKYKNITTSNINVLFEQAVLANDKEIVDIFLKNGADINYKTVDGISLFLGAVLTNKAESLKAFIENGAKIKDVERALELALLMKSFDSVKVLINRGLDINLKDLEGKTLLDTALSGQLMNEDDEIKSKYNEIAILLIDKGADVNAVNNRGDSVLNIASGLNNIEIAEMLVKKGADINHKDAEGYSPLHSLVSKFNHDKDLITYLINKGADVNSVNSKGDSILHDALIYSQDCVELLVNNGADVNHKNNKGESILDFLNNTFDKNSPQVKEVKDLLIKHGAK